MEGDGLFFFVRDRICSQSQLQYIRVNNYIFFPITFLGHMPRFQQHFISSIFNNKPFFLETSFSVKSVNLEGKVVILLRILFFDSSEMIWTFLLPQVWNFMQSIIVFLFNCSIKLDYTSRWRNCTCCWLQLSWHDCKHADDRPLWHRCNIAEYKPPHCCNIADYMLPLHPCQIADDKPPHSRKVADYKPPQSCYISDYKLPHICNIADYSVNLHHLLTVIFTWSWRSRHKDGFGREASVFAPFQGRLLVDINLEYLKTMERNCSLLTEIH